MINWEDFKKKTEIEKEQIVSDYRNRKKRRPSSSYSQDEWLTRIGDVRFLVDRKLLKAPIKKSLSTVRNQTILNAFKQKIFLTGNLKELIAGGLLGDFGMRKSGKHWSIKICQSTKKHFAYVWHLYDQLYYFSLSSPQPYYRNGNSLEWQWDTISHPEFDKIHQDWYVPKTTAAGKIVYTKIIPANFETDYLTDRALAYWYQDDGYMLDSKGSKGLCFATHGFTEIEVERLCQSLRAKYGWDVRAKNNKKAKVVAISGKNFDDVMSKIGPYIHPSMMYKIPTPRKPKKKKP